MTLPSESLRPVSIGLVFALLTALFGFGLGVAFGAAEDAFKDTEQGIVLPATAVLQGLPMAMERLEDESSEWANAVVGGGTVLQDAGFVAVAIRLSPSPSTAAARSLRDASPAAGAAVERLRVLRDALTDSKGRPLTHAEAQGIKFTIRSMEQQGFELLGSVKYDDNQGIDLVFKGIGKNEGTFGFAFAEAKAGEFALATDSMGIQQASLDFIGTRLTRASQSGVQSVGGVAITDLIQAFHEGAIRSFGGFAGAGSRGMLFEFDLDQHVTRTDFRRNPGARKEVK